MTRPLSILMGRDHEALDTLFDVFRPEPGPILDVTFNKGTMWDKCSRAPSTRSDIDPTMPVDVAADFGNLPFLGGSFDVVVYDPPHLPTHAASVNSSKMWERRYGITSTGSGREGDNVVGMFLPFLAEAKRVLKHDGLVFAKIADLVHNHRQQWQHVDFVVAARAVGMTPCDLLVKSDPAAGNLKSSKWANVHHLRKAHCYWIVVRNSGRCE